MKPIAISVLTICGIEELPGHEARDVTHVLSLLDPEWPELEAFRRYGAHPAGPADERMRPFAKSATRPCPIRRHASSCATSRRTGSRGSS